MSTRYTKEFKERAVRLLADSRENYSSETQALVGVAGDLGGFHGVAAPLAHSGGRPGRRRPAGVC